MARLEELTRGASVKGILPDSLITVVDTHMAGYAPYLDYRPLTTGEHNQVEALLAQDWLTTELEPKVLSFAVSQLVPTWVNFWQGQRSRDKIEFLWACSVL